MRSSKNGSGYGSRVPQRRSPNCVSLTQRLRTSKTAPKRLYFLDTTGILLSVSPASPYAEIVMNTNDRPKELLKAARRRAKMPEPMAPKNGAVVYIRVSTEDQVDGYSLETQEEQARSYCQREHLRVLKVFIEPGVSAMTASKRPAFQKALDYCEQHKQEVGFFIVSRFSRFSRNALDGLQTVYRLAALGIVLRSVSEPVDESAFGDLMKVLHFGIAQLDNRVRSDVTRENMKTAVQNGRWTWRSPLGYRTVNGEIEPDPKTAPLIAEGFRLYACGTHSMREVLRRINAQGLKGRHGKPLSAETFRNMLRNAFYAGWVVVPTWDVATRGLHQPIVEQDVWDRVQELLNPQKTTRTYDRDNPDHPLRGFVRCACGKAFTASYSTGKSGQKYRYYHCVGCGNRVPGNDLDAAFAAMLKMMQPHPAAASLITAALQEAWEKRREAGLSEQRRLETRVADLRAKRTRMAERYLVDGGVDRETYQEVKTAQDCEISEAEKELARLSDQNSDDYSQLLEYSGALITNAATMWAELQDHRKRRLQELLFPNGVAYDGSSFGTPDPCWFFRLNQQPDAGLSELASLAGFEPAVSTLKGWRVGPLHYRDGRGIADC
jgi:site-specific DNA recombinase